MLKLEARNISKSLGLGELRRKILERVDLLVDDGDVAVILGPSGCGKTTLLRIIAGLLRPDLIDSVLKIGGEDVRTPSGRVGFVFQKHTLFPWLTVEENVSFGMRLLNVGKKEITARTDSLLETTALLKHRDDYPGTLSGGQAQRVALARCLATDPGVLLLDEPFSALDIANRYRLRAEFLRVVKQSNIASVFVTHDIREALLLGDQITVLSAAPARVKLFMGSQNLKSLRHLVIQLGGSDEDDGLEEVVTSSEFQRLYLVLRQALK